MARRLKVSEFLLMLNEDAQCQIGCHVDLAVDLEQREREERASTNATLVDHHQRTNQFVWIPIAANATTVAVVVVETLEEVNVVMVIVVEEETLLVTVM